MTNYRTTLKFHQSDKAGIGFFNTVFEMAHDSYEHFVEHKLKFKKSDWFTNPNWIVPIKKTEAEFMAPLKLFAELEITTQLENRSPSAFTLIHEIKDGPTLCAKVKTLHVFCDAKTFAKISIPKTVLDRL